MSFYYRFFNTANEIIQIRIISPGTEVSERLFTSATVLADFLRRTAKPPTQTNARFSSDIWHTLFRYHSKVNVNFTKIDELERAHIVSAYSASDSLSATPLNHQVLRIKLFKWEIPPL